MEQIPVYSITINENDDETGVNLVSFVSEPAIEEDFITLSKKQLPIKLNHEKQIVTGAALIPDKHILRISPQGEFYNIVFSSEIIEKIRDKFHRLNFTQNTNDEHLTDLEGNFLVESWIVSDSNKDKTAALGLNEVPAGTWVTSYKITNSEYWDEFIKSGKRLGFSIEGFFGLDLIDEAELKKANHNKMNKFEKFYELIKSFILSNDAEEMAEAVDMDGENCPDCPNKEEGEKLGTNGGRWLSDRIDEMVTEEMTRGDIIAQVASAAGVDESTINQIISGEIDCPPLERLEGFASVMGVEIETVITQFREDGCSYSQEEEAAEDNETEEETAAEVEPIEQSKEEAAEDWANLEALAKIDELKEELKRVKDEKDAEITALKEEVKKLSAKPAAAPVDTTPTPVNFGALSPVEKMKYLNNLKK